jgi:hypothetical protein
MFSVITHIYEKKTKERTLMELFTAKGKLEKVFWQLKARIIATVKNIDTPMLTRVWQELKHRIDVCRVSRCAHIENI